MAFVTQSEHNFCMLAMATGRTPALAILQKAATCLTLYADWARAVDGCFACQQCHLKGQLGGAQDVGQHRCQNALALITWLCHCCQVTTDQSAFCTPHPMNSLTQGCLKGLCAEVLVP